MLTDYAIKELESLMETVRHNAKDYPPDEVEFVFSKNGKPLHRKVVWEWWYKAAKQAEIDINLYQATKHSLGMRYVMMDGARLDILQALFGHADIRTTQKYARFLTQETTDVFRALVTVSSPLQITDK